jgi:hypothetical protein
MNDKQTAERLKERNLRPAADLSLRNEVLLQPSNNCIHRGIKALKRRELKNVRVAAKQGKRNYSRGTGA